MAGFSDGVRPGGLYDTNEIQILICYMLSGVAAPLPRTAVTDILTGNEMANLFEVSAAIDGLVARQNLAEDEEGLLTITDSGREAAAQLFDLIPYTLRERSLAAAMQLLARARFEREAAVTVTPLEQGVEVTCSIDKSEHPMMSFTLRVADEVQAKMVREQFLNNPTAFYRTLIALATDDYAQEGDVLTLRLH